MVRRWRWPWARRAERRTEQEAAAGQIRQEAAVAFAELRFHRRSLDAAITQMMQTQAERAEESE